MNSVHEWHEQAMSAADQGDSARRHADPVRARLYYRQALQDELRALDALDDAPATPKQPTRAILQRSAAWLAYEAGELETAERLTLQTLLDPDAASESQSLRELLLQIYSAWGVARSVVE
jgi:hypothetical protein